MPDAQNSLLTCQRSPCMLCFSLSSEKMCPSSASFKGPKTKLDGAKSGLLEG